jgi:hypothetical protein
LKREWVLPLFVFGILFLAVVACGKKAPPFLPEKTAPLKVTHLTGEWKDGVVYLKGDVAPRRGEDGNDPDASGCIVYHARYDLMNPPCEGCPIEYGVLEEIKAGVFRGDRFRCQLRQIQTRGVHFFKVRLLGPKGTPGPSSNRVKILIDD